MLSYFDNIFKIAIIIVLICGRRKRQSFLFTVISLGLKASCPPKSRQLNAPVRIVKSWKSRENVIRRRRIPSIIRPLKSKPTWKTPPRKGTTRYSRTTSLVYQRKTASISFCPDLLPRPRNQFSAGLSPPLLFFFWNALTDGTRRRKSRKPTFDVEREKDGTEVKEKQVHGKEGRKTHQLQ